MKCLLLVVLLFFNANTKSFEQHATQAGTGDVDMVENGEDEILEWERRWKIPSYDTVQSYVSTAYNQYMPSQETIDSYLPALDYIRGRVYSYLSYLNYPLNYFKWRIFGSYQPQKLLTEDEKNRLVKALSDKLLKKDGGEEITHVLEQLAPAVASRAQDNIAPIVIRLVVYRVVNTMALGYIGPIGALLARKYVNDLADAIADRAVEQYISAGPNRIDLYSYLKQVNWSAVYSYVESIVADVVAKKREEGYPI